MGDDLASLVGMIDIVLQPLFQIGVVVADSYVVIVGDQTPLHEPRLVTRARHYGYRVGRHDPFEVGRHVVALQRQNELVTQLRIERYLGFVPRRIVMAGGVALAQVAHRVVEISLEEAYAVRLVGYVGAEYQAVGLILEPYPVVQKTEVAVLVEVEQHRAGVVAADGTALDYAREIRHVRHVAEQIMPPQAVGKVTRILVGVEEVGRRLGAPAVGKLPESMTAA